MLPRKWTLDEATPTLAKARRVTLTRATDQGGSTNQNSTQLLPLEYVQMLVSCLRERNAILARRIRPHSRYLGLLSTARARVSLHTRIQSRFPFTFDSARTHTRRTK